MRQKINTHRSKRDGASIGYLYAKGERLTKLNNEILKYNECIVEENKLLKEENSILKEENKRIKDLNVKKQKQINRLKDRIKNKINL